MWVVLPIIGPLFLAALLLVLRAWPQMKAFVAVAGGLGIVLSAYQLLQDVIEKNYIVVQMGHWPAPFGITLVADRLSAMMVMLSTLVGFGVLIYSLVDIEKEHHNYGYLSLVFTMIMGVNGAFLTGDLFNMYVWFEVMLVSSFVLISLGSRDSQLKGSVKYVILNLLSSGFFLIALSILYATTGTLNLADLSLKLSALAGSSLSLVLIAALLLLVAYGIKGAIFPFFFWLPDSYHTPSAAVSALFAGLLTKVGVYAVLRVMPLLFKPVWGHLEGVMLLLAGATMLAGIIGTISQDQRHLRRLLSFLIIAHIGYMLMGLAMFSKVALTGIVFYLMHHMLVKTNLFFLCGVIERWGSGGGLYRKHPWFSILFLISALSLAGVPPLSGFWAKMLLIRAGLETSHFVVTAVAIVVGVLILYVIARAFIELFWNEDQGAVSSRVLAKSAPITLLVPIILINGIVLGLSLFAEPFMGYAQHVADQMMNSQGYINAVLIGSPAGEVSL